MAFLQAVSGVVVSAAYAVYQPFLDLFWWLR